MRKFAIYYTNGDVVRGGGEDDEYIDIRVSKAWLEAPADGVAVVIQENDMIGRSCLYDMEYYYYLPDNSHGKGDIGSSQKIGAYLRQMTDKGGLVKFGGWTHDETFQDVLRKATRDEEIRPQSNRKASKSPEDSVE